jgi:hypothetical protein
VRGWLIGSLGGVYNGCGGALHTLDPVQGGQGPGFAESPSDKVFGLGLASHFRNRFAG